MSWPRNDADWSCFNFRISIAWLKVDNCSHRAVAMKRDGSLTAASLAYVWTTLYLIQSHTDTRKRNYTSNISQNYQLIFMTFCVILSLPVGLMNLVYRVWLMCEEEPPLWQSAKAQIRPWDMQACCSDLLLLLLRSQLCLWGSPGFFWVVFFCCCFFFNPTIEVVTFRLRGWCMLGMFLLPAFTRLGHECQDLWVRAMECMSAQTRTRLILSSERVLGRRRGGGGGGGKGGGGVRTNVDAEGKITCTGISEEGGKPRRCIMQDSEPNTLLSYSGPARTLSNQQTTIQERTWFLVKQANKNISGYFLSNLVSWSSSLCSLM